MAELLTKREKQCLDAIKSFLVKNGYTPSLRELAKAMKMKSSESSYKYLHRLEQKNRVRLGDRKQLIVEVIE